MRKSLVLATILVLVCSAAAFAGVPDPTRSGCEIVPPPLCQFRFNASGTLDTMTLLVTLRDAFDVPVAGCTTTAWVTNPSLVVADCKLARLGVTDAGGVIGFYFNCLGGRGTAELVVTARYEEAADALCEWYGGLVEEIAIPLPRDPADDASVAKLVEELRDRL